MRDQKVFTSDGQFDSRKARQLLYEWSRDNRIVAQSHDLARHLGLSGEDTYLLMAANLLSACEGLMAERMEEYRLRVPTFRVQATQSGPFVTEKAKP